MLSGPVALWGSRFSSKCSTLSIFICNGGISGINSSLILGIEDGSSLVNTEENCLFKIFALATLSVCDVTGPEKTGLI